MPWDFTGKSPPTKQGSKTTWDFTGGVTTKQLPVTSQVEQPLEPSPLSTLPIPEDMQAPMQAAQTEGAGNAITDFFAQRRAANTEAVAKQVASLGGDPEAVRNIDLSRMPNLANQFVAGAAPPLIGGDALREQLSQIPAPQTFGEKAARTAGSYAGAIPLMSAVSPLGSAAAASVAKAPVGNVIGRLAIQGAARGGVNVGAAEVIRQGARAAGGEDVTALTATRDITSSILGGAALGAVISVATPYLNYAAQRIIDRFTKKGNVDVAAMTDYTVKAGSDEYNRLINEGWQAAKRPSSNEVFLHKSGEIRFVVGDTPTPSIVKAPAAALEANATPAMPIQPPAQTAPPQLPITPQPTPRAVTPEAQARQIWARTKSIVDNLRQQKPLFAGETEFKSRDSDRGYARYIDEYFDELPKNVQQFWMRQRIPDLETGEMNYVSDTGVRGGHVWQVREQALDMGNDLSPIAEMEQNLAANVDAAMPSSSTLGAVAPGFQGQQAQQPQSFAFQDPNIEARFSEARKGVKPETLGDKVKEFATTLQNKATRVFETLPNTPEFAQAKFDLIKLGKQRGVVADRTVRIQQGILADLMGDPETYNLFERSVILNDLVQEAKAGRMLPFGFDDATVTAEKARLDAAVASNPNIQKAIAERGKAWDAIKDEYVAAMDKAGFDVSDRFKKEDYFRHQVLAYAQNKGVSGAGGRLRTPTGRGFLKQRQGSEMDINANYLQAEFEVMAQMLQDIEIAKVLAAVDSNYNIAQKVKTEAKQQNIADWRANIPETHVAWQPREGNMFYHVYTIPEQIADQVLYGSGLPMEVAQNEIGEGIAVGRRYKELVIPKELAETLDNLNNKPRPDALSRLLRGSMNTWKQYQLTNPKRVLRYNIRNVSGDAEAVAVGNPRAFLKVPQAVKELVPVFTRNGAMSPELREWFNRGGMESTLQAAELGGVDKLKVFARLFEQRTDVKQIPVNLARKLLVEWPRLGTDLRESVLRYAAYLDYLEQMQNNNGNPLNYGASIPEEVNAISDPRDKAFKLANDLLGAYDEVSVLGQGIRQNLIPFWSWKEVNFKRYLRFIRNAAIDPNVAAKAAKGARIGASLTASTALRVGGFLVKAAGLWGLLTAWNTTMFPEAERDLSESVRKEPHIILYIDQDGKPVTFTRLGMLADFLSVFGIDGPPQNMVRDFLNGKKTAQEVATEMAKDFVNEQVVQSLRPDIKMFAETVAGKQIYPDVFKPRPIRDKGLYLAEQLGLGDEYKAIANLPSRPYLQNLRQNIATYTYDPNQSAYYEIQDLKRDFLKKIGKEGDYSGTITPRSQALYNYKMAIRFEDKEAAKRYLREYAVLGGTAQGLQTSLRNMEPLHGLTTAEKTAFMRSLSEDERRRLTQAVKFYNEVLLGNKTK